MMPRDDEPIRLSIFRKSGLPIPIVIMDDEGNFVVQSLEPAGPKKLGARVGLAPADVNSRIVRALKRNKN